MPASRVNASPGPSTVPTLAPDPVRASRPRAAAVALGLALGLPAAVLCDTGLRLLRGWRPTSWFDRQATLAIVLACAGAIAALAIPASRRALGRRWPKVAVIAASCAVLWMAAEVALTRAEFHRRLPGQRVVFTPDPRLLPGVRGEGVLTVNELGLRGDPLPAREDAYRILCVGGSTTECLYLDDGEAWPRLLQDELGRRWGRRAWTGNAGISGYATSEHLAFLERFEPLGAMDCVVVMAGMNDYALLTLGERRPIRLPWELPAWLRSDACQLLRTVTARPATRSPFQDPEGRWIEERRVERRGAPRRSSLPDISRGLAAYEDRLERIVALCAARGVRLVLANQAVLWREGLDPASEDLLWTGWTPDSSAFYEPAALRCGMDAFNQRLAAVGARHGLEVIDVARISGDPGSFYDDCHFTEEGARRVADLVASRLTPH